MFFNGRVEHDYQLLNTKLKADTPTKKQQLKVTSGSQYSMKIKGFIFMIMLVWLLSFEHQVQHIFKPTVDLHFNHILTI